MTDTDDEREALRGILSPLLDRAMGDYGSGVDVEDEALDTIIAAGFRRQGPITDDEREAMIEEWREFLLDGPGRTPYEQADTDALASAIADSCRQGPITDEWEYAHEVNGYWNDDATMFTAEDYYHVGGEPVGALARRRKAGPWEPVEAAREA